MQQEEHTWEEHTWEEHIEQGQDCKEAMNNEGEMLQLTVMAQTVQGHIGLTELLHIRGTARMWLRD